MIFILIFKGGTSNIVLTNSVVILLHLKFNHFPDVILVATSILFDKFCIYNVFINNKISFIKLYKQQ